MCINIYIKRAYIFRLETELLLAACRAGWVWGGDRNILSKEDGGDGERQRLDPLRGCLMSE